MMPTDVDQGAGDDEGFVVVNPFASPADLTDYLSGDPSYFLEVATALVVAYCRWHIYPVITETITIDGSGRPIQPLPSLRVIDIQDVVNDGWVVDMKCVHWSRSGWMERSPVPGYYTYTGDAMDVFGDFIYRHWSAKPQSVTLTITHGYTVLPAEVKNTVLAIAARASLLPASVVSSETAGPFARKLVMHPDGSVGGVALIDSDREALARYRIAVIA